MNTRSVAARAIKAVVKEQRSLADVLPALLPGVADGQAGLAHELIAGSLRWWWPLSTLVDALLQKPLRAKEFDVYCLIVTGLYQIEHTRIPDHAAVSETVKGARALGKPWSEKLVNALLRRYLRERSELNERLSSEPTYRYAHPAWMIETLARDWPQDWQALLDANNHPPGLTLRVNCQKTTPVQAIELLAEQGIGARRAPDSPVGLVIDPGSRVWETELWAQGLFSVQDESAQLAGMAPDLKPGMHVLDACAAPGGKTCHLLEREPALQLLALDKDPARLKRIEENLVRLGLDCQTRTADASNIDTWWDNTPFDLVILDAPCSGSGVINKHPDIKHLRRPADIEHSAQQQGVLLDSLWPLLRQGGKLLYLTCSVLRQENDAQALAFMHRHSDASCVPLADSFGLDTGCGRQRLPGRYNSDGFYYAYFEKR